MLSGHRNRVLLAKTEIKNHKEDGMKSQTTLHVMLKRLNLILEATGSH